MKDRLIEISNNDITRMIVISDIHGYYDMFHQLLDKLQIREEDYLIILGDSINKGPQSLETIRYLIELDKRERTHVLAGNHEATLSKYLMNDILVDEMLGFVKKTKRNSLIKECSNELKVDINDLNYGLELKKILLSQYKTEFEFINTLNYGLQLNNFIFVHAGIDEVINWKDSRINSILRLDEYYKKKNLTNNIIVVGHWPTQNMRELSINNDIMYVDQENIICIDGGTIKANKQINALILNKEEGYYQYKQEYYDSYIEVQVIKNCKPYDDRLVKFDWMLNQIEILERGNEFSLCKNIQTNKTGYLFNDLIIEENGKYLFNPSVVDYVSLFLKIKKGEKVKYVLSHGRYSLVKYHNEFGWVLSKNLKL